MVAAGEHQLLTLEFSDRQAKRLGFIGNKEGYFGSGAQDVQVSSDFVFARQVNGGGGIEGWTVLNLLQSKVSVTMRSRQLLGKLGTRDAIIVSNDGGSGFLTLVEAVIGSEDCEDYAVDRLLGRRFPILNLGDKMSGYRTVTGCFFFQDRYFNWVIYNERTKQASLRSIEIPTDGPLGDFSTNRID